RKLPEDRGPEPTITINKADRCNQSPLEGCGLTSSGVIPMAAAAAISTWGSSAGSLRPGRALLGLHRDAKQGWHQVFPSANIHAGTVACRERNVCGIRILAGNWIWSLN
ncbi:hypothetical protein Vretimale_4537, partial [Volvox reticuliferus]